MRVALELLYVIVYFSLGWMLLKNIYAINEITNNYSWLGALAILIIFFVLYRNKRLFPGVYQNKEGRNKLTKNVSVILISLSAILIITPFILILL